MSNSPDTPWYKLLNREHWFVFTMASLAWMFDCLDQQLFNLARPDAMKALLEPGQDPKLFGGYATAIFVAGWAMGGLIFGADGDRIGRAKTLTFTVLIYSLCTGLSAFSTGFTDFAIYRFITGLGVGGVFGLAVALVADSLPDKARPSALGLLQALSAVGNVTASLIAICVGYLELGRITPGSAWSKLFLIGALPAFLCVFIQIRLKEPEKWIKAKAASKASGTQLGSYSDLLGNPRWRSRAIPALFMCVAGVVGVWGIGFFSVELINDVIGRALREEGVAKELIPGNTTIWKGINLMMQNVGAFLGMMTFTRLAARFGLARSGQLGADVVHRRCRDHDGAGRLGRRPLRPQTRPLRRLHRRPLQHVVHLPLPQPALRHLLDDPHHGLLPDVRLRRLRHLPPRTLPSLPPLHRH